MADPHGKELTIALADQAFRSRRPERIADQLAYLLERYGVPQYMDWWERVALLMLGGAMAHYLPSLVVPPIVARLRHETQNVILPGEEEDLRRYLAERRRAGMRLNLNQLGEAILGEAEAARRLDAYLALLARDDVEYISVKVSSVFSQIDLVAFRATVDARGRAASHALPRRPRAIATAIPDGRVTPKFINLDMEEYRDLDLTVTAFREVLDEPEFLPLSAGSCSRPTCPTRIACSARSPTWALARRSRGGAPIKLRIVKGANLAMERIEAGRARLAAGAVRDQGRGGRQLQAHGRVRLPARARGGRAPRASPATTSSTSPTASALREAHRRRALGRVRDARGHGQSPGAGGARARRRAPPLRARSCAPRTSTARSPISSAGSTRTRRRRTSCATSSTSSRARRSGPPSAIGFLAAFEIKDDAVRRASPHAGSVGRGARRRPSPAPLDARFAERLPTPTGRSRPNRAWIEEVVARLARAAAGGDPAPGRRRAPTRAPRRRTGAIPRARTRVAYRYALAGPRRRRSRARRRPRRAARRGPGCRPRSAARLLEACAAELGRRRGDLIGAMILDGAKTVAGGGRRGLGGRRLRALLRARRCVETDRRSWPTAAWSRSAWSS